MRPAGIRHRVKKWVPVGSPLWYPYFLAKRFIKGLRDPSTLKKVVWYVAHQNILLEDYKAIYIPIPKVACSSLEQLCAELLGMEIPTHDIEEEIHLLDFPYAKKYKIKDHYADYFKFAFVRNPWSRLVSCYNDKINYEGGHVYERYDNSFINYLKKMKVFSGDMSFDRFVEVICDIPDEYAEAHFRSQHQFVMDERGNILTDFIGRFERLQSDVAFISEKLNMKIKLPHIRQSKPGTYKDFYNSKTVRLVERRYELDLDMFGYTY